MATKQLSILLSIVTTLVLNLACASNGSRNNNQSSTEETTTETSIDKDLQRTVIRSLEALKNKEYKQFAQLSCEDPEESKMYVQAILAAYIEYRDGIKKYSIESITTDESTASVNVKVVFKSGTEEMMEADYKKVDGRWVLSDTIGFEEIANN